MKYEVTKINESINSNQNAKHRHQNIHHTCIVDKQRLQQQYNIQTGDILIFCTSIPRKELPNWTSYQVNYQVIHPKKKSIITYKQDQNF